MPGEADVAIGNELLDTMLYVTGVTYPTLAANVSASNTLTVPGVLPGDFVGINLAVAVAHLNANGASVSAPNTVTIWWGTDATGVTGAATAQLLLTVVRPSRPYTTLPSAIQ